ncbi:hypothetical protein P20652_3070 [Pseudoalteromonas sp. BSi20652]|uniref:hypothetical protein n=1 Tax=Pseudoalteromonas sp. BSi20652 TaxID=388384 RepID=UPI0002318BF3|nr:hypothetical protein [Pseudoalteromonas sp. BSi20652]GAA61193.1 hypothetical protein P20652_3070 [Pseudoalteromonas sp. BSi20652]
MPKVSEDPAIRSLLNRMPLDIQTSFSDEQLTHLKIAIGARQWGNHAVDYRGVLGFFKYRYYFVLLAGRNKRNLSPGEQRMALCLQAIVLTIISLGVLAFTLLVLYLIKSALGINLIEGFSLGIWDWFKALFK